MSAAAAKKDANVTGQAPAVKLVPMLTITRAIDLFLGDCARRGYSQRTQDTYGRLLDKFADSLPPDTDVTELKEDDCRKFLDRWRRKAAGTRAHAFSVLSSFTRWLYVNDKVKRNPMDRLERPKRIPAEDLDVKTFSADDVRALLKAAETPTERMAVAVPAYMGCRRRAAALLRLSDYDRKRRRMRFREKGGKVIWKPVPDALAAMIEAELAAGTIRPKPNDYLIPSEATTYRGGDRDDRIVWRAVKTVAERAGVDGHVHALRAAFAVFYLETHTGDIEGLKELLGHRSIATTQVYLRKLNRGAAMERVRGLSWGVAVAGEPATTERPQRADERLAASSLVGAGGFEPPFPADRPNQAKHTQPSDSQEARGAEPRHEGAA